MDKDVLFILTDKYHGMILDCQKLEYDQYDIITRSHGLLKVFSIEVICRYDSVHHSRTLAGRPSDHPCAPSTRSTDSSYCVFSKASSRSSISKIYLLKYWKLSVSSKITRTGTTSTRESLIGLINWTSSTCNSYRVIPVQH